MELWTKLSFSLKKLKIIIPYNELQLIIMFVITGEIKKKMINLVQSFFICLKCESESADIDHKLDHVSSPKVLYVYLVIIYHFIDLILFDLII